MTAEKYTFVEGGLLLRSKLSAVVDETYQLFVDVTAVRRADDQRIREAKVEQILKLLDESNIANAWQEGCSPADLEVQIGYESRGYGVFGMNAELSWPSTSDKMAALIATYAMRKMAYDLGTYPTKDIPGMVYAQVSRSEGIALETNPAASSSMDTDGNEYDATSDRVSLYAHNLYTHEMQLICISGLIALAKAR